MSEREISPFDRTQFIAFTYAGHSNDKVLVSLIVIVKLLKYTGSKSFDMVSSIK